MPPVNPFLQLTAEFNEGRLRAIICSGQAVVLHRLAMMSKDGDWIVREESAALEHIREVLARHRARYRFGAPLDVRWLAGGWSSHLEFRTPDGLRVRTDFFTRPPRLSEDAIAALWRSQEGASIPFVGLRDLALMKMTQREKDYSIIGELARSLDTPADQLRFSRSARDLVRCARDHPQEAGRIREVRPLLEAALMGDEEAVAVALDAERRSLMRMHEARLAHFQHAALPWAAGWSAVEVASSSLPLADAHAKLCSHAERLLPFAP